MESSMIKKLDPAIEKNSSTLHKNANCVLHFLERSTIEYFVEKLYMYPTHGFEKKIHLTKEYTHLFISGVGFTCDQGFISYDYTVPSGRKLTPWENFDPRSLLGKHK